jgi:tetratricopeptide (TPR) repeat protein
VYQNALKYTPDSVFVHKIGQAFMLMHDYSKAISYYKSAITGVSGPESHQLRLELASLLRQLKRNAECLAVVQESLQLLQGMTFFIRTS